ncbi:MAG: long-chain fatty acid--CoA ligase [Candidatus Thiodiazotropha sp.]
MNQPKTDYIGLSVADTLPKVFLERVRRTPDKTAYIQYDGRSECWIETSWREMHQRVARWQAALQQEKLKPGDRVAILMKNCREWVTFDIAALGLGLVVVPLYINDRAENIGYILQDADIRLLLIDTTEQWQNLQQIRNQLAGLNRIVIMEPVNPPGLQPRLLHVDAWLPESPAGEMQIHTVPSNSLATIVYTSGTTGRSKGVMLSHRNILWDIESGLKHIAIYPSDHFLSFLPLSHTLERTVGYYLAMVSGAVTSYARSIPKLAEDLQLVKPTILVSVPRIFERIYAKIQEKLAADSAVARGLFKQAVNIGWAHFEHQQGRGHWSASLLLWPLLNRLVGRKIREKLGGRLRIAMSGGAPISTEIAQTFISLGVPILQGYGLTETSPIIAANTHENNIPSSVGIPFPGIEIRIGDQDELLCRSPSVMMGYWNNPEATAQIIDPEGWFHTGDKAKIQQDHIFITGRLKDIIVLANGEKVPPADMEMCISMDSLFEHALVVGEGKPYLSALIRLNAEHEDAKSFDTAHLDESQEQALLKRINAQLDNFPGYAKIVRISLTSDPWNIENGLVTPTLKLRRNRILAQYQQNLIELYRGH